MQEQERARALPALAFLPAEAEFVLALRDAGSSIREMMRLLGCPMNEEHARCAESIADAAIVVGSGPGGTPRDALPIFMYASRTRNLASCEEQWCQRAKPEFVSAIQQAFRKQASVNKGEFLSALERFHPAPVYCAATPRPGRENDFATTHAQIVEALKGVADREAGVRFVQHGPYSGLRMSQLRALELLTGETPQDADVRLALEQRELYLLTMMVQNASLSILCENPADISLPPSPEFSMLYSPKLDRSNPHLHHLVATAWVSSALSAAIRTASLLDRLSVAQAVVNSLREVSMQDGKNRPAYEAASAGVAALALCPSALDEVSTPLTMQMWQQDNELTVETVGGAQGMTFEPGKLRLVQEATAPGSFFYMESTAFSVPHLPDWAACRTKLFTMVPDICNGIALTLRKSERGSAEAWAYYMRLFSKDVESLGEALNTLSSGMCAPFAILGAEVKKNVSSQVSAWAIGAAVKNREAVSDGWQQVLGSLGQALGKLGLPPILIHAVPIEHKTLGQEGDSYTPILPFASDNATPSVALSSNYFVLGNNTALNAHMLLAAKGEMPFTGAVNSVHIPTLARVMSATRCPMIANSAWASQVAGFLQRVSERVEWFFSTSTINNDLRTARARMILSPENTTFEPARQGTESVPKQ